MYDSNCSWLKKKRKSHPTRHMLTRNATNIYAAYKTEEQDRQEDPEDNVYEDHDNMGLQID